MIVAEDDKESVDCRKVFHAALLMFGLWQLEKEFVPALERVASIRPDRVLEIGTGWGGSLFAWAQVAAPDAHLISIDLPGGIAGGGYTPEYAPRFNQFLFPDQRLTCILQDSAAFETVARIRKLLGDDPLDLLFIDGSPLYEAASADYRNYAPLVREGGIIILHDVKHNRPTDGAEPIDRSRLWGELKQKHPRHEAFVSPDVNGQHLGVGVLFV